MITIENVNSFRYCRIQAKREVPGPGAHSIGTTTRTGFPVPQQHSEERRTATAKFMIVPSLPLSTLRPGIYDMENNEVNFICASCFAEHCSNVYYALG